MEVPNVRHSRTALKEKALLVITTAVLLVAVLVLPLALELRRSWRRTELYQAMAKAEMKTWTDNIGQAVAEVLPGDSAGLNVFVKATFGTTSALCSWNEKMVTCTANHVTEVYDVEKVLQAKELSLPSCPVGEL
jgi:hypothetical protein